MSFTVVTPANAVAEPTRRRPAPAALVTIPAIAPGQLWLIEHSAGNASAAARHALAEANVVIYDPALADAVAASLPLGSYAEPVLSPDAAAERGARFARDGWSVARLLPARLAQRERTRRVQDIVDVLAAAKVAGRLTVTVFAEPADGPAERFEARFDDIAGIVAAHPRDTLLSIVIDAFGGGAAPRLHGVAANGLAG